MARHQVRVTSLPGCLKACDVQLVPAFCHSAKLSVCVSRMCSVSLLLSKIGNKKVCSNKERQRKTRSRRRHLISLRRAKVVHSTDSVFLPAHALSQAGIHTVCAWSEVERQLHSWGSQLDLAEGMETGGSLSLSSPARSTARSLGSEAHSAVSSPQRAGSVFHLSPSEEEDVESADYSPIQSPQYEELLEVVTRAVAKLNIDWPADDLERLAPLVDRLAAWKLLSNVSRWVLQTVEKGYRIQFGAPPPPFKGLFLTSVSPEQALILEQEVSSLLRKEAIEVVPPLDRESGFYSRYFIVPKKDGGLRPILDLRLLNCSVRRLKFRMLTVKQVVSQIRSEDWFVTIDLKDAYFHISILSSHRKFLRFAFRGKAYQYRVLPFGLTLSPRIFTKCVDAALTPATQGHLHT